MEIAERFKFFKRTQGASERTADFMAVLRRLAKTCNFGQYLETALRDQFVGGVRDEKVSGMELLVSIQDLMAAIVLQKATAAETVSKESQAMWESVTGQAMEGEVCKLNSKGKCYCCGKLGHQSANCKYKNGKCYVCQKVGHLASMCQSKRPFTKAFPSKAQDSMRKAHKICTLQEKNESNSDTSESEHLHTILQLGTKVTVNKFLITVKINKVPVEMEVDSGAERSTVSLSVFQQKLADVCTLQPSGISLHQYDKSPLTIAGECQAKVNINNRAIHATFVVVDVDK